MTCTFQAVWQNDQASGEYNTISLTTVKYIVCYPFLVENQKVTSIGDTRIIENKDSISKLVFHYLINEKNHKGLPINDVCRFHLGNGAIIDDIVINGNVSEPGFKSSFGIMVNYLYELENIEKNHEDYVNNKKVIFSGKLKKYF